jgi:signal transduction histidine kinase/CheY-like chemotaxis protein
MKTVLLVTGNDGLRSRLRRPLGNRSIFSAGVGSEALEALQLTAVDLIVADATAGARAFTEFAARARELAPGAVLIGIGDDDDISEAADFRLAAGFESRDLTAVLKQAEQRHDLVQELTALRLQAPARPSEAGQRMDPPDMSARALEQALKEFAKALAAGFDLRRMLELFLDAVGEIVRPSRGALLLADENRDDYRIRAHRGLAPQIVESLRLPAGAGLPRWLSRQGRLLHAGEVRLAADPTSREVARDLGVLQAVMAIPLIAHGELVAILVLGEPIFGGSYSRGETEILFTVATQFGTAIRDIRLHHQLQHEKVFSERILAHMSSGVITIGRDQRVSTVNRRAEEILQLRGSDVLGRDLRVLPSPLGDLLYDTLTRGRSSPRTEIQLAFRGLPLEVSTYPITGDEPLPLGAVLVFEDLSAQKALAAEKRQADQFQLLTRVVARITDEIKNPMVSISTLMELLEERYDDPEFRHHFSTVVRRDVRRVVQVFEKLTALVNEGGLNFELVDLRAVVDEMLAAMGAAPSTTAGDGSVTLEFVEEGSAKRLTVELYRETTPQFVKADRGQLKKALSYLLWYLMHRSPDHAKVSLSMSHGDDGGDGGTRLLLTSRTAEVGAEEMQRMFDPMHVVQDSLIDLGPAVSQRLVEAQGGRLQVRQARHELSFMVTLPEAAR